MQVSFQLEPEDYEALNAFVHRGTLLGWLVGHMNVVGLIFMLVFAAWVFDRQHPITSGFSILLFTGFLVFFWRRRHRGLRKRGAATFATYTIGTSLEGIQTTAPGRSASLAWSHVQGYGDTAQHIFVMLDGVAGQVVPKRCLSGDEVAALLGELKEHATQLPSRPKSTITLWRLVLLWVVLVMVVFLAWHFAQVQRVR
jgi:hypothetical protein